MHSWVWVAANFASVRLPTSTRLLPSSATYVVSSLVPLAVPIIPFVCWFWSFLVLFGGGTSYVALTYSAFTHLTALLAYLFCFFSARHLPVPPRRVVVDQRQGEELHQTLAGQKPARAHERGRGAFLGRYVSTIRLLLFVGAGCVIGDVKTFWMNGLHMQTSMSMSTAVGERHSVADFLFFADDGHQKRCFSSTDMRCRSGHLPLHLNRIPGTYVHSHILVQEEVAIVEGDSFFPRVGESSYPQRSASHATFRLGCQHFARRRAEGRPSPSLLFSLAQPFKL